jgi:hypothetical protein
MLREPLAYNEPTPGQIESLVMEILAIGTSGT